MANWRGKAKGSDAADFNWEWSEQGCPVGKDLFGWCPGESVCAKQVYPTVGEQNQSAGDAAWPRQLFPGSDPNRPEMFALYSVSALF